MELNRPDQARVSLCKGVDRAENLRDALSYVIDDIDWDSRKKVIIKPNLVKAGRPYAVTHPDALKCVLAMVRERYQGPLVVAEGSAEEPTYELFKQQGFEQLTHEYDALLVDLNRDEAIPFTVYNRRKNPLRVRLARQILEADCRISLCLPKTHDHVVVTLSIKNMVMGSLINRRLATGKKQASWRERLARILYGHGNSRGSDKIAMHQDYSMININLARLAPFVLPHLSIVDGFVGMEGAGPTKGQPVPWGIALAGTDALAVDSFAAHLMGFNIDHIGYLHYCANLGLGYYQLDTIKRVGNVSPQAVIRAFTPHPRYQNQLRWHHPNADRLLKVHPNS